MTGQPGAADPTTHPVERGEERTRAFARLVAHHQERADTVEDTARRLLADRASTTLTAYAYRGPDGLRASKAQAATRLRLLLEHAAHTAGADLAARPDPHHLVTPCFDVWVDHEYRANQPGRTLAIDYDPASGPPFAATAVRLLEAAANGDPDELVATICCAEQHVGGEQALVDTLMCLAELAAALTSKAHTDPTTTTPET